MLCIRPYRGIGVKPTKHQDFWVLAISWLTGGSVLTCILVASPPPRQARVHAVSMLVLFADGTTSKNDIGGTQSVTSRSDYMNRGAVGTKPHCPTHELGSQVKTSYSYM